MHLAHKIRIYPNKEQEVLLKKACGVSRYTYNWALSRSKEEYKKGNKLSLNELKKIWNKEKPEWVYESPKDANQQPFANLNSAYQRFFKKLAKFPKFKKKSKNNSFYISNDQFAIKEKKVRLPKIGWVKLTEKLRFEGKILSGVVSRKANQWFIAISVKINKIKNRISNNSIGVDLGLISAITTNDGFKIDPPKPFSKYKKKLAKLQRSLARKTKFGKNWKKHLAKLQRAYLKLANIRHDFWHKQTSKLCNENQVICIEDLAIANLIKNRKLSSSFSDASLGMFRLFLSYKNKIWNNEVVVVDKWFPSSQLCSSCGNRQKLELSKRTYCCSNCGLEIDRDVNAAKNILTEGLAVNNVCGQETSGLNLRLI